MRFTQKKLYTHINNFLEALTSKGYVIDKVILFGSYANGYPTEESDIDLAIWSPQFSDDPFLSRETIRSLLQTFTPLQVQTYTPEDSSETDPFIGEIERTGKVISHPITLSP